MAIREDIEAVTIHLADGSDVEFDGKDIHAREDVTEIAVVGKPAGKGTPVRFLTIIVELAPDPTLAKGH